MECRYHKGLEAVDKCKVCGAPLCKKCQEVQNKFLGCPECSKKYITQVYRNYKNGLIYNILSVLCAIAFTSLFIINLCIQKMKTSFIVLGSIVVAVLLPLSIYLLFFTIKNIKKTKSYLDISCNHKEINTDNKNETDEKQNGKL